jgi:hypothetical protein
MRLVARNRAFGTLEEKLGVCKRIECNENTVDIAIAMGIPESTSRTVREQDEKIKESCKSAVRMTASKVTQVRVLIVEELEGVLAQWIEHQRQCASPLSTMIIQAKQLPEFFKHIDTTIGIIDDNDANRERRPKLPE